MVSKQDGQAAEGVGSVPQATAHGQQGAHPMQAQEAVQMPPASDHLEAAEAALASLPKDIGSEPERLMVLCEKLAEVSSTCKEDGHWHLRAISQ